MRRQGVTYPAFCLTGVLLSSVAWGSDGPVVAQVRDGECQMVVSGQLAIFTVKVTGLVPKETLTIESISNGERMFDNVQAAADGKYLATLFVQVSGDDKGTETVTIQASRCTLSARFAWSAQE
jgi:hypothetical protein